MLKQSIFSALHQACHATKRPGPSATILQVNRIFRNLPNATRSPGDRTWFIGGGGGVPGQPYKPPAENLAAMLSSETSGNEVIAATRRSEFEGTVQPAIDDTIAALTAKYGRPAREGTSSTDRGKPIRFCDGSFGQRTRRLQTERLCAGGSQIRRTSRSSPYKIRSSVPIQGSRTLSSGARSGHGASAG